MSKHQLVKDQGDSMQAVIELYKKDVDRTLIRQNLKLTVEERLLNLQNFNQFTEELRIAGKKLRKTHVNLWSLIKPWPLAAFPRQIRLGGLKLAKYVTPAHKISFDNQIPRW